FVVECQWNVGQLSLFYHPRAILPFVSACQWIIDQLSSFGSPGSAHPPPPAPLSPPAPPAPAAIASVNSPPPRSAPSAGSRYPSLTRLRSKNRASSVRSAASVQATIFRAHSTFCSRRRYWAMRRHATAAGALEQVFLESALCPWCHQIPPPSFSGSHPLSAKA